MSKTFTTLLDSLFSDNLAITVQSNGGSMRPTLPKNAVVRLEPIDPDQLKRGDIVLFEQDATITVMHRVVRKFRKNGKPYIQTWGDNVRTPDVPIPHSLVKARVTAYQDGDNWITLQPDLQWFKLFITRNCRYFVKRAAYKIYNKLLR